MADMAGIITTAEILTCCFFQESVNTMLSNLFANEGYYTIKENNNKEKSFYWGKLPFCQCKLPSY